MVESLRGKLVDGPMVIIPDKELLDEGEQTEPACVLEWLGPIIH